MTREEFTNVQNSLLALFVAYEAAPNMQRPDLAPVFWMTTGILEPLLEALSPIEKPDKAA